MEEKKKIRIFEYSKLFSDSIRDSHHSSNYVTDLILGYLLKRRTRNCLLSAKTE